MKNWIKIGLLACVAIICSVCSASPPAYSQPVTHPQTYTINDTAPVQVLYSTPLDMSARVAPGYIVTQFVFGKQLSQRHDDVLIAYGLPRILRNYQLITRLTLDTLDMFYRPFKASNVIIWEVVPAVDQLPPPLIAYSGICPVSNG